KTDAGEDLIASCANCGYAANLEKAASRLAPVEDPLGPDAPEEFPTPGVRTIEDLTTFPGGAAAECQIKTLAYVATVNGAPVPLVVLLRGDHQLHETKLADTIGATALRAARPDEIQPWFGASAGSLGAVGLRQRVKEQGFMISAYGEIETGRGVSLYRAENAGDVTIIADLGLKGRRNMTTGANKDDHHLRGVEVERDIHPDKWADLRSAVSGESCPRCQQGTLEVYKAMEIGHIFKLGTKYSASMGATVLTPDGKPVPIVMGSYGIGVERIITAAIEQNHDDNGIIWPKSLSPFDVIVTVTNVKDVALREAGEKLYKDLQRAGLDVLLDDRDERAGVKFKDADLIGVPYRITLGRKVTDGIVELFERTTKTNEDVKLSEIVLRVQSLALAGL
ncbi:MAG: His/Gly/Thr/Pro-type tRNA ligase C-terminal domain-containing protein, partial [Acidobacteriota bacterium]|nr:His/Gly/Thr/Pro-type tRNA ligase C-terminal domain-containing protein [Acidobacteriota bacterium]